MAQQMDTSNIRRLANQYQATTGKKLPPELLRQIFQAEIQAGQQRSLEEERFGFQKQQADESRRQYEKNFAAQQEAQKKAERGQAVSGAANLASSAALTYGAGKQMGWWGAGTGATTTGSTAMGTGTGSVATGGAGSATTWVPQTAVYDAAGTTAAGTGSGTVGASGAGQTGSTVGGGASGSSTGSSVFGTSFSGWALPILAANVADQAVYNSLHEGSNTKAEDATKGFFAPTGQPMTMGQYEVAQRLLGDNWVENAWEVLDPTAWLASGDEQGVVSKIAEEIGGTLGDWGF